MLHRIIISSFGLMTLAMCQTQKQNPEPETTQTTTTSTTTTGSSTTSANTKTSTSTSTTTPAKTATTTPKTTETVPTKPKETPSATSSKTTSGTVYLSEGQNIFLKDQQMNVTFKKMVEDSRCPKDVNCIWEGVATAEVELMGVATRPRIVHISTQDNAAKGLEKTVMFDGYAITMTEVSPYPTQSKNFNNMKGSYKIGLSFKKGSYPDPTTSRGGVTTK